MVEGNFKKGNLQVTNKYILDLPNGIYEDGYIKDMEVLKEVMDSFLRLNDIKRRDAIGVVNSTDILTRDIVLPSVTSEEVEGILKYKINDYIPIDLESYVVQYINQGVFMEGGNEKLKIFIIAMPKEIISSHFNLLEDLNFKARILDVQSNAVRKLISFNSIKVKKDSEHGTIANIDIGYFNTKLTILKEGNIEISRTLALGTKNVLENLSLRDDTTEKESLDELLSLRSLHDEKSELRLALNIFLGKLFENLEMVFRYYSSLDPANDINLILLQGSVIKIEAIQEQFQDYLNIKTLAIDSIEENTIEELYLYSNAVGSLIRGEEL